MTYQLKTRLPGQWFWRTHKGVTGHTVSDGRFVIQYGPHDFHVLPLEGLEWRSGKGYAAMSIAALERDKASAK